MSELRVDSVKSKGGGAPDLPKGVTISGITTAATLGATTVDVSNVNVSGVVTSGTLNGPLLSTGTPTLGLGVTINSSGVAISGVATAGIVSATTLYGDGSNITGVGASIAPLFYQPDVGDTGVLFAAGIGITFNQQIKAGTGNITIRETNASGTVVENFGVGSSVTISENRVTIDPTADLSPNTWYYISYPSGCFTNNEGTDYVGTAYTFQAKAYDYQLFSFGQNDSGRLGLNNTIQYSSPVQIPGTTWKDLTDNYTNSTSHFVIKTDGTLWGWGDNSGGRLGQNNETQYSSPVQVGSDTNWASFSGGNYTSMGIKTDGTLWTMGYNAYGGLGQNEPYSGTTVARSSPVQIPGTTWSKVSTEQEGATIAVKTDGTLWAWGNNEYGELGQNNKTRYSSPTQIPGTDWNGNWIKAGKRTMAVINTDGELWMWGSNTYGVLAQGNRTRYSSPVQVGSDTTWRSVSLSYTGHAVATKTDGSLWVWGASNDGTLGLNETPTLNQNSKSSPVRMGSASNWSAATVAGEKMGGAINTDGECWVWGQNNRGQLGQNSRTYYSSPVQIPGTAWNDISAMKEATILQTKSS